MKHPGWFIHLDDPAGRQVNKADRNADGVLDRDEFQNSVHPEESWFMRDVTVMETWRRWTRTTMGRLACTSSLMIFGRERRVNLNLTGWPQSGTSSNHRDKDGDGLPLTSRRSKIGLCQTTLTYAGRGAPPHYHIVDSDDDNLPTKDEILERYDVFCCPIQDTEFCSIDMTNLI